MNKLKINNKDLYILDKIFSAAFHEYLYNYVSIMSNYQIGFQDTELLERAAHMYYTADFGVEHLEKTGLFSELEKNNFMKDFLKNRQLIRATINSSTASQVNFPHTHYNQWSLLYYINTDWKPEWAGETLFYNEDNTEIEFASIYKPNRCILFDGGIPHSLRCQSTIAPNYRFSLAMFFSKDS